MSMDQASLDRLHVLVEERQTKIAEGAVLEKRIEDIDAEITMLYALAGQKGSVKVRALGKDWSCYTTHSDGKENLNRLKLIEAGVTNEQLKAGTTRGRPFDSVTVRKAGEKENA